MTLARFDFTETYLVGVPELDKQHARFFEIYNEMVDRHADPQAVTGSYIASVFNELFMYSKYHFREEEWIMKTSGYPNLREHVDQHQKFIEFLTETRRARGSSQDTLRAIEIFVEKWADHILVMDQAFGNFLLKR